MKNKLETYLKVANDVGNIVDRLRRTDMKLIDLIPRLHTHADIIRDLVAENNKLQQELNDARETSEGV
jgi:ABC-type transporter Mla subunit MlaD